MVKKKKGGVGRGELTASAATREKANRRNFSASEREVQLSKQ